MSWGNEKAADRRLFCPAVQILAFQRRRWVCRKRSRSALECGSQSLSLSCSPRPRTSPSSSMPRFAYHEAGLTSNLNSLVRRITRQSRTFDHETREAFPCASSALLLSRRDPHLHYPRLRSRKKDPAVQIVKCSARGVFYVHISSVFLET